MAPDFARSTTAPAGRNRPAPTIAPRGRARSAPSARRFRLVVGVERAAKHVVVGVGAEPELRRVGLADDDGAGTLDALDVNRVGGRHEILEDARALGGADALGRGQ